jgi:tetratricopeptide (TPR) repeat protein
MNTYEFWNEMDKIYDAIVAYQEKTIEFNKRFINPWIKLGNVFDKQESNEAIIAHKNAIEIDPENAQNWLELANAYTHSGDFNKSIQAYQEVIELGLESGEVYKNLALAHVMTGKYREAIPLFENGLNLLENDKEKAVVWNHIGNVYRKMNNYELALQAFQNADQFESAITLKTKELPSIESDEEITEDPVAQVNEPSAPQTTNEPATVMDSAPVSKEADSDQADEAISDDASLGVEQTDEHREEEPDGVPTAPASNENEDHQTGDEDDEVDNDMPVILELDFSTDSPADPLEETITDESEEPTVEDEPVEENPTTLEEDGELASVETMQEESEAEVVAHEEGLVAESPVTLEEDGESVSVETMQEESEAEELTSEEKPVAEFLAALEEGEEHDSVETTQEESEAEVVAPEEEPVAESPVTLEEDGESVSVETMQEESEAEELTSEEKPVAEFLAALEEDEEQDSVETTQEESEAEVVAPEEEPVTESLATSEEGEEQGSVETTQEEPEAGAVTPEEELVAEVQAAPEEDDGSVLEEAAEEEDNENDDEDVDAGKNSTAVPLAERPLEDQVLEDSLDANKAEKEIEPTLETETSPTLSAYGEFLKDNAPGDISLTTNQSEENQTIAMTPADVEVSNSEIDMEDVGADLTVAMDTKNAHVWNELGNVYFNAGSFDDAIAAYSKAIELDKQFAWPYTNLALSYVQKGRLGEAIVLYQRSIELFSSEKDKAVTWNRLGNVYRRLNDYENAIAAYQRADELDPGNIAITHQSRFSLLGSEKVDQEAGYSL